MGRPARTFAALVLCVLTLGACADAIEVWEPPAELGICARTPAVREAIVALTDRVHSCAFVDAEDLTAIRRLDLSERGIEALQAGDFAGLKRLRELRLNGNALHKLPDGVFDGLAALRLVHLHDNPGSPFPLRVNLRVGQQDRERWLYLRLPLRPPARVIAHLQSDGVLLANFAAVIDEGSYASPQIIVDRRSTSAGTARVLRVAADRESRDCGREPCWTGIHLIGQPDPVEIPALSGDGEPPRGLPTLVLRVDSQSFAEDVVVERGVIAGSGQWRYYLHAERPDEGEISGECTVTQYTTVSGGGSGMSGANEYHGECRLAMGSGSSTPAYEFPLNRIGTSASGNHGSELRSGAPCLASPDLRIVADAERFNETQRIDAVNFDAEGRCYYYISVAQDPNRTAPFRLATGEACVVEAVDRRVSASGCQELIWWGGWGFGGVASLSEARADAALTRPYVNGSEQAKRLAAIAACEMLPEVSLTLDKDSFRESPFHHRTVSDEQGLCELNITAMAPQGALARGEQCVVSAKFALVSAYDTVPTRQSGDCDRIVHQANWSRPSGRWSEEERQAFLEQFASGLLSYSDADWQLLLDSQFCINDICSWLPSDYRDE